MYNLDLHFHFTGIGGSGMSGLAEVLLSLGFRVSGSDLAMSPACERLSSLGAVISVGHDASHLANSVCMLVYSSAVRLDNPEILEAYHRGIPVLRRAELLAELMRLKFGVAVAGSHGKTTTTSMTAAIMDRGGLDPTTIIGGQVRSLEAGAKAGTGPYLVAETDESDRSFLLLKPTIAVVTNIDAEHMNAYASIGDLEDSFRTFVNAVPFYGLAVLCVDDPRVRDLARRYTRRLVTYGCSPDAMIRAENITVRHGSTSYRVVVKRQGKLTDDVQFDLTLPMPGVHLAVNSLASIAVGIEFGIPVETIVASLEAFSGVKRRAEVIGSLKGISVVSDYAHHPTEIRATLAALRASWPADEGYRLHAVFQPHRYTRTRDCFAEFLSAFDEADHVTITDIYTAGENPIEGVSGRVLSDALMHTSKDFVASLDELPSHIAALHRGKTVVACLGAGSIGACAEKLPWRLGKTLAERGLVEVAEVLPRAVG